MECYVYGSFTLWSILGNEDISFKPMPANSLISRRRDVEL
jgi:hypothetical protein